MMPKRNAKNKSLDGIHMSDTLQKSAEENINGDFLKWECEL